MLALEEAMSYAEKFITLPDFPALLLFNVLQGVGIYLLQSLVLLAAVTGNLICYQLQQALQNQPQLLCHMVRLPTGLLFAHLTLCTAPLSSRQDG